MSLSHSNFREHLRYKMHGPLLKMEPNLGPGLSRKYISNTVGSVNLVIYLLHFHTPKISL